MIAGILGLFLIVALVAIAVTVYLGYRLHKKAEQVTQTLSSDPGSLLKDLQSPLQTPQSNSNGALPPQTPARPEMQSRDVTAKDGQCALFTKDELTQVLGTNFTHADADSTGCTYAGDAPREWVRTEALWKGGRKLIEDKKTAYAQLSHSMPKANIPIQPYPSVGDEAWVNLWNVVTACKGHFGIVMDLRYYHDSDELTKMLTNTALSRLRDERPDSTVRQN